MTLNEPTIHSQEPHYQLAAGNNKVSTKLAADRIHIYSKNEEDGVYRSRQIPLASSQGSNGEFGPRYRHRRNKLGTTSPQKNYPVVADESGSGTIVRQLPAASNVLKGYT